MGSTVSNPSGGVLRLRGGIFGIVTCDHYMRLEVQNAKLERIAAHSHIKGLGLGVDGSAIPEASGFAGQESAREVFLHQ